LHLIQRKYEAMIFSINIIIVFILVKIIISYLLIIIFYLIQFLRSKSSNNFIELGVNKS